MDRKNIKIIKKMTNTLKYRDPVFDPTFYAVHHVSSNLDFSSDKMLDAIKTLEQK